jgi:hypothetical protein
MTTTSTNVGDRKSVSPALPEPWETDGDRGSSSTASRPKGPFLVGELVRLPPPIAGSGGTREQRSLVVVGRIHDSRTSMDDEGIQYHLVEALWCEVAAQGGAAPQPQPAHWKTSVQELDGWYESSELVRWEGRKHPPLVTTEDGSIQPHPLPPRPAPFREEAFPYLDLRYLGYAMTPSEFAPFPELYHIPPPPADKLCSVHVCYRCFMAFYSEADLSHHLALFCPRRRYPGVTFYKTHNVCRVDFIDGRDELLFCRCLALLGKCFVIDKDLVNDMHMYEFYLVNLHRSQLWEMEEFDALSAQPQQLQQQQLQLQQPDELEPREEEVDENGAVLYYSTNTAEGTVPASGAHEESRFRSFVDPTWDDYFCVGYFCRLKNTDCEALGALTVFPPFQRRGLGSFILDMAYETLKCRQTLCGCKTCGAAGTGGLLAKPFSPSGKALIHAYWRKKIASLATYVPSKVTKKEKNASETGLTFADISKVLGIHRDDLVEFLLEGNHMFYPSRGTAGAAIATLVRPQDASTKGDREGGGVESAAKKIGAIIFPEELLRGGDGERERGRDGALAHPPLISFDPRDFLRSELGKRMEEEAAAGEAPDRPLPSRALIYNRDLFHRQ